MRLEAFAGDWDVEREIEDVRAGRTGRFAGARPLRAGARRASPTARRAGWRSTARRR